MNEATMKKEMEDRSDIYIADNVSQSVKDMIENGIDGFSNDFTGQKRTPCYATLYDGNRLIGGLRAESLGEWFYIKHLWVDEHYRGRGIGRALMDSAENEAVKRGCRIFWVDTLSYQAPDFYRKAGYRDMATVPSYRGRYDRIFFRKDV